MFDVLKLNRLFNRGIISRAEFVSGFFTLLNDDNVKGVFEAAKILQHEVCLCPPDHDESAWSIYFRHRPLYNLRWQTHQTEEEFSALQDNHRLQFRRGVRAFRQMYPMSRVESLKRLIELQESGWIDSSYYDFVPRMCDHLDPFEKDSLDTLLEFRTNDTLTENNFRIVMYDGYLPRCRDKQEVLEALSSHADQRIRESVPWFQNALRVEELNKDIDYVRRVSPLQPGTCMRLSEGLFGQASGWLQGREYRDATLIGFARDCAERLPMALIEFEEEIHFTDRLDREHTGRHAVLQSNNNSFYDYDRPRTVIWTQPSEETIDVYLFKTPPKDADLASSCVSETRIETQVNYNIIGGHKIGLP